MHNEQFSKYYAEVYDLIYRAKDYEKECKYVMSLFNQYHGNRAVKYVLDIACGTGGHAIPLAKNGFVVTAQDISGPMVEIGRKKAEGQGIEILWHPGVSMHNFSSNSIFDAIICMFSAIDYVIDEDHLCSTFTNVHNSLSDDGIFIFDFWNREAVKSSFSSRREKVVNDGPRTIRRVSDTELDPQNNLAHIAMHWTIEEGKRIIMDEKEIHTCRYYDVNSISEVLKSVDLEMLSLHPFMNEIATVTNDVWNITAVCRKKK